VILIDGLMAANLFVFEVIGLLLSDEQFDILALATLIAIHGQHIVGALVDDLVSDVALVPHGIDGNDGAPIIFDGMRR
jgi:hypothetical protein